MRTVKSLIEELQKFPPDAVCFAYEGEVTGVVIEYAGGGIGKQGVIYCGESRGSDPEKETELLPP